MTDSDPRLAACALAVGPLLASGSPAEIARAVVLEWLKQEASPLMTVVGQIEPDGYMDMCAQAAKEIA